VAGLVPATSIERKRGVAILVEITGTTLAAVAACPVMTMGESSIPTHRETL
jgi:hypothetical protein